MGYYCKGIKNGEEGRVGLIFLFFFIIFLSCSKQSLYRKEGDFNRPAELHPQSTIIIDIEKFTPQKFICDIKGNIFTVGNGDRLVMIRNSGKIEELNIQDIYPCQIVDIATDGFDIFLLDKMNRKIWTVKREKVLGKGFSLAQRPLLFDVSEKGRFAVIYNNKKEISIFSKERKFGTVELEKTVREGRDGALVFRNNNLYLANNIKNSIDIMSIYASSKDSTIDIVSPSSIAVDEWGNLFICSKQGLVGVEKEGKKKYQYLSGFQNGKIFILKENIFVLHPQEKRIYVFKIKYTNTDPDLSGNIQ
jgi:hypothetical protein